MPARRVKVTKMANGGFFPEVEFCDKDKEKLKICGVSQRSYYAIEIEVNKVTYEQSYSLWKLHRFDYETNGKDKFFYRWIATWNTDCCTSIRVNGELVKDFGSIDNALVAAINDGWKVCQLNYDNLEWIIDYIKHEHNIR